MFELVFYGTLAVVMVVVLWSVLGQQIGRGPDESTKPEDIFGTAESVKPRERAPALALVEGGVAAEPLPGDALRARDPEFDERVFEDQATTAYAMVLEAFAGGDRDTLAMLLTPRMQDLYGKAIDDREAQELTQVTDILRIVGTDIKDVRVEGDHAEIDVKFRSELSSALLDSVGQAVMGDPDLVARTTEVWTFERDLSGETPDWQLSDVAPEEGDALPADPAPDTTE